MAGILALAGGAIINALAFSGTNYMFNKLSDHGAAEKIRHGEAIEQLQKSQASWASKRQKKIDFINEALQRENHAEKIFSNVDEALEAYYVATKKRLPELSQKPVLSDFLPSE